MSFFFPISYPIGWTPVPRPIIFIILRRTSNKSRHTAPKSRTSSVAKTGYEASPVSPTSRLKPNPSPIPHPPTRPPPLQPPHDPDQNPTSVPPPCPQTQAGALPNCPITAIPKHTFPPKVLRPPYQVSLPRLTPPFFSYVLRSLIPRCHFQSVQQPSYHCVAVSQPIPRTDPEPSRSVSPASLPSAPQSPRLPRYFPPH